MGIEGFYFILKNSMTTHTYESKTLAHAIAQWQVAQDAIQSLVKLEQYIIHGVESFGWTSIVIQWRWVNATMIRYRDLYIVMVRELKWEEETQKAIIKWVPGFPIIE